MHANDHQPIRSFAAIWLALLALIFAIGFTLLPANTAEASDGIKCSDCGEWYDGDDWCPHCYRCPDCYLYEWCDIEDICVVCACNLDSSMHCSDCMYVCFMDESTPFCMKCMRCADCAGEMVIDEPGGLCRECAEADPSTLCPACEEHVIRDQDGNDLEDMGECGEHCKECYAKFECNVCGNCTKCMGHEICESCGACDECQISEERHCELCGDCFEEVDRCGDDGLHCHACCEANDWLCWKCGRCVEGAQIDMCMYCGLCDECYTDGEYHCEECDACYEDVDRCHDGGLHCRDCCEANDWLCAQCDSCFEGTQLDRCPYCDLCSECCADNAYELLGDNTVCIHDPKVMDEAKQKHDKEGKHVLVQQHDSTYHWSECVFEDCGYVTGKVKHTPDYKWKAVSGGWGSKSGVEKCGCTDCLYDAVKTRTVQGKTAEFVLKPLWGHVVLGLDYKGTFRLVISDVNGKEISWDGGTVTAYRLPKGETWPSDPAKLAQMAKADYQTWERSYPVKSDATIISVPGKQNGMPRGKITTEWRLVFWNGLEGDDAYYVYSDSFKVSWDGDVEHVHHMALRHAKRKYSPQPNGGGGPESWCHWLECSCGEWGNLRDCMGIPVSSTQTCEHPGETTWVCTYCNSTWKTANTGTIAHQPDGVWSYHIYSHWQTCKYCGAQLDMHGHDYDIVYTSNTCTHREELWKCKTCGFSHTEIVWFKVAQHQWGTPVYMDKDNHRKTCTVCGQTVVEKHKYLVDKHLTCDCGAQENMAITWELSGDLCTHGTATVKCLDSSFDASVWDVAWIQGMGAEQGKTLSLAGKSGVMTVEVYVYYDSNGKPVKAGSPGSTPVRAWDYTFTIDVPITIMGYDATCIAEGIKWHRVCPTCGRVEDDHGNKISNVKIPKKGHTYDNDCDRFCNVCGAERDANHTWNTFWYHDAASHWRTCSVCGTVDTPGYHELTNIVVTKAATCEDYGTFEADCLVCGGGVMDFIPPAGHNLGMIEQAATCIMPGWARHYGCERCGLCYDDPNTLNEVSPAAYWLAIDPTNHVGGKMHHSETHHWIVCQCGETINKAEHTWGYGDVCMVCGYAKGSKGGNGGQVTPGGNGGGDGDGNGGGHGSPWWLWLILVLVLLLILAAVLFLILLLKKRKQDEEAKTPAVGDDPHGGDAPPGGATP